MKITDVRITDTFYVPARPQQDAISRLPGTALVNFCQVFTDGGHIGLVPAPGGKLTRVLIEEMLKPVLVGEDPMDHERLWQKMYWNLISQGRRGAPMIAIGILDCAIWDLKGRITGQPLHKLLGAYRDRVPSYGSGINMNLSDEELVTQMRGFVDAGFPMVKMKIGHRDPRRDVERIRLVREAIGPDADLCVDANNAWSVGTAIELARLIEPFDIYWLEEPVLADEIDGLAALARATRIPIAAGENHYGKWEFRELIGKGAVGVVQADVVKCGGVTEFLKIAAMADAYGLPVCPHFSPFTDVACIAAIPNGVFHEHAEDLVAPVALLVEEHPEPSDGTIAPLDRPGFGLTLRPDAAARFGTPPPEGVPRRTTERAWRWPPYA
ncbi:mandelate racemase/muconate lactonizing enzyme family protein [Muricoccus vinaceus]|uniref:Mandelate racemase/muconate lactonizing enzyme family protein n=1 Tax=Muricoccus vinaceus TaxID=424704 RepID=A0ABV6ITF3_9PROT